MKVLSKQEFSYSLANITGFTSTISDELITKSLVGAKTASLANLKLGVKGSVNVPIMDSTLTVQDSSCSATLTGVTSFTQVNLSSEKKTVFESYCNDELYSAYQSLLIKAGQDDNDDIPFEVQIADLKAKQIAKYTEQQLWQAVSGTSSFSGIKALVTANAENITGATFDNTKAITAAGNPIYEVSQLIDSLTDDAADRDDLIVWMSHANLKKYKTAMVNANLFHYPADGKLLEDETMHVNSNVKIVATAGLKGSNMVVVGPAEYLVVGMDLSGDEDAIKVFYSMDDDIVKLRAKWSYCANLVTFSDENFWIWNGLA